MDLAHAMSHDSKWFIVFIFKMIWSTVLTNWTVLNSKGMSPFYHQEGLLSKVYLQIRIHIDLAVPNAWKILKLLFVHCHDPVMTRWL